jgi:hypothetical protein
MSTWPQTFLAESFPIHPRCSFALYKLCDRQDSMNPYWKLLVVDDDYDGENAQKIEQPN